MGGKLTQAPATPELVESDDWALEIAACGFANDSTLPDNVRSFIKDLWRAYCAMEERDDTLEAQQARIAELEAESAALTKALTGLTCGGSEFFIRKGDRYVADIDACVSWVRRAKEDAHRRTVKAITEQKASQALADRYEKALIWIALFAEMRGRDSDRTFAKVARGAVQTIAEHSRQALSSQGRREGVTSGSIPELPGVNAVPLPASPDGTSQMDRVWAAINVLGAPDTACTTDEDRAYCRAIGDALSEIEKLGGRPQ